LLIKLPKMMPFPQNPQNVHKQVYLPTSLQKHAIYVLNNLDYLLARLSADPICEESKYFLVFSVIIDFLIDLLSEKVTIKRTKSILFR
jgi:hypothetical protein